mgnify:CR=1 FL=1
MLELPGSTWAHVRPTMQAAAPEGPRPQQRKTPLRVLPSLSIVRWCERPAHLMMAHLRVRGPYIEYTDLHITRILRINVINDVKI